MSSDPISVTNFSYKGKSSRNEHCAYLYMGLLEKIPLMTTYSFSLLESLFSLFFWNPSTFFYLHAHITWLGLIILLLFHSKQKIRIYIQTFCSLHLIGKCGSFLLRFGLDTRSLILKYLCKSRREGFPRGPSTFRELISFFQKKVCPS